MSQGEEGCESRGWRTRVDACEGEKRGKEVALPERRITGGGEVRREREGGGRDDGPERKRWGGEKRSCRPVEILESAREGFRMEMRSRRKEGETGLTLLLSGHLESPAPRRSGNELGIRSQN